ncbi:TRAP transporter small permease [Bacillus carboniphilus]|uniref:TRAP transporter small permease n=1 Tax=Bacillus carboniphilus TaxID=86663 RepID=A0ABN0VUJ5_9BACI
MKKLLNLISKVYLGVAIICMVALLVLLTLEIVARYFFDYSFVWSQEFFSILICWITFLGFGKVVVDREDIMISFFVKKLSEGAIKMVGIVNSFLLFGISAVMLYFSFTLTISHLDRTTLIMRASSAWFYAPLVLLLFLMVLVSIQQIILSIKGQYDMFAGEED